MDMHSNKDEFISKLELLETMHITSSQLYSWKRKGLIPREWFIKEVTRTGQITIFPRNLIVSRIRDILRYKEKYSLDKVEKLISPESSGRMFSLGEILKMNEINADILEDYRIYFTYTEVLFLLVVSDFQRRKEISNMNAAGLLKDLSDTKPRVETDTVVFAEYKGDYFSIITVDDNLSVLGGCRIADRYSLCEVSETFKKKYESLIVIDREELVRNCIDIITAELGGV